MEFNIRKLVRRRKTIILYIEFPISRARMSSRPNQAERWEMVVGWRRSLREGTIIRSNNGIICSIVCNPNCIVHRPHCWLSVLYIIYHSLPLVCSNYKHISILWYHEKLFWNVILSRSLVTFKDSIRYRWKDFGSIKERFSFLIFHLVRSAWQCKAPSLNQKINQCLFQNKIPRILINRRKEISSLLPVRWTIQ